MFCYPANLFFKSPKRLKIDGSLLQGDDTAEDFDIADLLCDPGQLHHK